MNFYHRQGSHCLHVLASTSNIDFSSSIPPIRLKAANTMTPTSRPNPKNPSTVLDRKDESYCTTKAKSNPKIVPQCNLHVKTTPKCCSSSPEKAIRREKSTQHISPKISRRFLHRARTQLETKRHPKRIPLGYPPSTFNS